MLEEASRLKNLEDSFLGKSKIDKTQSFEKSSKKLRLDVRSNRSASVENMTSQECSTIEELCLAGDSITDEGVLLSNSTAGSYGQLIPNLSVIPD